METFPKLMRELGRLIREGEKVPREIVDATTKLAHRPEKLAFWIPDDPSAIGAQDLAPGLHPSDLLLEIVAAARAADWEKVGVLVRSAG